MMSSVLCYDGVKGRTKILYLEAKALMVHWKMKHLHVIRVEGEKTHHEEGGEEEEEERAHKKDLGGVYWALFDDDGIGAK